MIRKFILKGGEKLTDVFAIISLIVVLLGGIGVSSEVQGFGEGLLVFLVVEIVGIIYVIMVFFFIYVLIDIRNTLQQIEKNTEKKEFSGQ